MPPITTILLEGLGYLGTILTLMSMMMTSVVKLRTWSAIGSFISMVYAIICGAWPVVFLNVGLIVINMYHLMRMRHNKIQFDCVSFYPYGELHYAVSVDGTAVYYISRDVIGNLQLPST